jgi:hypothetical protein
VGKVIDIFLIFKIETHMLYLIRPDKAGVPGISDFLEGPDNFFIIVMGF